MRISILWTHCCCSCVVFYFLWILFSSFIFYTMVRQFVHFIFLFLFLFLFCLFFLLGLRLSSFLAKSNLFVATTMHLPAYICTLISFFMPHLSVSASASVSVSVTVSVCVYRIIVCIRHQQLIFLLCIRFVCFIFSSFGACVIESSFGFFVFFCLNKNVSLWNN